MTPKLTSPSKFWQDRPTLVTGGTGLVGGALIKKLVDQGADVVCIVRDSVPQSELYRSKLSEKIKIVEGDICDQALVERALGEYEINTVIHLAAQTIVSIANRNPISTFESNIKGTWALLEACRRNPTVKQIVTASSDKAYGESSVLPYSEDMPLQGRHPYDVSKSCSDLISQSYSKTFNLPVVITRCGNFYGGGDLNWNRIIPGTIRAVLRGERPVIRSDGTCIRDYFFVEDGAAVYMMIAEHLATHPEIRGNAYNFSNESQIKVLEITNKILKLMNSKLEPDVKNQASNEIPDQHLSAQKARDVFAWKPLFSLDQGLAATIEWYRNFFANGNNDK